MSTEETPYADINTSQDQELIEISLDTPVEDVIEVLDPVEVIDEVEEPELTPEKEVKEEKAPVVAPKQPKTKKQPRSQKRIKGLLQENAAKDEELQALQLQVADMQKMLKTTSKTSSENMAQTLEGQIQALQAQFTSAMEEGDAAKTVAAQDELMNAKLQLAGVKNELKTIEAQPEPVAPSPVKKKQDVSEYALDWIEDHPSFKSDPIFNSSAMAVNRQLIQEGYNPNDLNFYAELDARLKPRFADLFDTEGEDVVEYDQGHENTPSAEETLTPSQSSTSQSDTLKTPPVSGAARAASVGSKTAKRRNTISLTPLELVASEELGMSRKEYGLRKKHIQDNTSDSGYTPIMF